MRKFIMLSTALFTSTISNVGSTASGPTQLTGGSVSQQIVQLNTQLQAQLKQMHDQQQQQIITLNTQLQAQMKQMHAQIQKIYTENQNQMKQMQAQIKQVQQQAFQIKK
ncbi:hypothetical protein [Legionella sp.]|uniref:hypothetical protein n=1 Tax=Legionella sp. TaxID=459 RepID=UPI003C96DDFE